MQKFIRDFLRRQAARFALPAWLRILMPATFLGVAFGMAFGAFRLIAGIRGMLHPDFPPLVPAAGGPPTAAFAVAGIGTFIFGACSSILISNLLVASIPPVRVVLDRNASGVRGGSFAESMKQGWRAIGFVGLPILALSLIVALFSK
ncbi:MAG: hypothetical protein ACXWR1_05025 [Bdellovibrionota bacterium]